MNSSIGHSVPTASVVCEVSLDWLALLKHTCNQNTPVTPGFRVAQQITLTSKVSSPISKQNSPLEYLKCSCDVTRSSSCSCVV